jgi:nucleobase transporter 1/2
MSAAGKFGGIFASLPQAMVSGLFCVMFGLIAAVGISQLQFTDQNSPRNIFIVGLGLYLSLSIPDYFITYTTTNNQGPINTKSTEVNGVLNSVQCMICFC